MIATAMSQAIRRVADQFTVEVALNPARIEECYRLRCGGYNTDWPFMAGRDDRGQDRPGHDEFDQHARHVALVSRQTDAVMGTARLVLPLPGRPGESFPLQRICAVALPADLPIPTTADVSCFALSHDRSFDTAALLRLGLFQGLIRLSGEIGLTHWCAVMEPTLLRLLRMTGMPFNPIGPLVDYGGHGQPCYNSISAILSRASQERPAVWEYLTDSGRLWLEPAGGTVTAGPGPEQSTMRQV